MAESKHTPGPWRVARDEDGCLLVETVGLHPSGVRKVITRRTKGMVPRPEDEADARLMAAAPALLEALEGARKSISDVLDNCPYFFPAGGIAANLTPEQNAWREKVQDASRKARAALAKARP